MEPPRDKTQQLLTVFFNLRSSLCEDLDLPADIAAVIVVETSGLG
jgi:hypothetical protein